MHKRKCHVSMWKTTIRQAETDNGGCMIALDTKDRARMLKHAIKLHYLKQNCFILMQIAQIWQKCEQQSILI